MNLHTSELWHGLAQFKFECSPVKFTIRASSWSIHHPFMLGRYKVEGAKNRGSFGLSWGEKILAERRTDREYCDNKRRQNRAKKEPANTI
jgi:hypothetical protein